MIATYPTVADAKRVFRSLSERFHCIYTDANAGQKNSYATGIDLTLEGNVIYADTSYFSEDTLNNALAFDRLVVVQIAGDGSQTPRPGTVSIYSRHRSYEAAERVYTRKQSRTDDNIVGFDVARWNPEMAQWESVYETVDEYDAVYAETFEVAKPYDI